MRIKQVHKNALVVITFILLVGIPFLYNYYLYKGVINFAKCASGKIYKKSDYTVRFTFLTGLHSYDGVSSYFGKSSEEELLNNNYLVVYDSTSPSNNTILFSEVTISDNIRPCFCASKIKNINYFSF